MGTALPRRLARSCKFIPLFFHSACFRTLTLCSHLYSSLAPQVLPVEQWSVEDVQRWLEELSTEAPALKDHISKFSANGVKGSRLLKLTDGGLIEMGLPQVLRIGLLEEIEKLRPGETLSVVRNYPCLPVDFSSSFSPSS